MRLTTVVINLPHPPFLVVFFFKLFLMTSLPCFSGFITFQLSLVSAVESIVCRNAEACPSKILPGSTPIIVCIQEMRVFPGHWGPSWLRAEMGSESLPKRAV